MLKFLLLFTAALSLPAFAKLSDQPSSRKSTAPPAQQPQVSPPQEDILILKDGETLDEAGERMCIEKLGNIQFLPVLVKPAREQAFANVLANAMTAALDQPEHASNERCFHPMFHFDHFLKNYFMPNYTQELVVGEAHPYVTLPNGSRGQLNCSTVLHSLIPQLYDVSIEGMIRTVGTLIRQPERLQKLIEVALKGKFKNVNYADAKVQEIAESSEHPNCAVVKLDSRKYEYGRAFLVCADSTKSSCLNYYGGKFEEAARQGQKH